MRSTQRYAPVLVLIILAILTPLLDDSTPTTVARLLILSAALAVQEHGRRS